MQHLLPWVLASLSIALLLYAGALWRIQRRRRASRPLPSEWALTARPVFSSDERQLYRQLREALPRQIVLAKLPLVRFCQPTDPDTVRYWYRLLGTIHVSFAICSANGRVVAAIDVETERNASARSAKIKQAVLAACGVRYLRCQPDALPSIPELQLLVPQAGSVSRAAQPSSAMGAAHRDSPALWQDSGLMQDSFFGGDAHSEVFASSGFGTLRSGLSMRELPPAPEAMGGVVIDTPVSPLRH